MQKKERTLKNWQHNLIATASLLIKITMALAALLLICDVEGENWLNIMIIKTVCCLAYLGLSYIITKKLDSCC